MPNFGASFQCNAPVPVLLLEDFEHLTDFIACQPGNITIDILSGVDKIAAIRTLLSLEKGGLIVTSHYGCNKNGERNLFR